MFAPFFFFNDTATTEIYTLSLHDALPISRRPLWEYGIDYKCGTGHGVGFFLNVHEGPHAIRVNYVSTVLDRKSTRLNSSHANISYAVFCLKKKKTNHVTTCPQN